MPTVCTACGHAFNSGGPCPRCGGRNGPHSGSGPRWLHTMSGRLFIGLIVSQGLFYALERLLTGMLLAAQGGTSQELWAVPGNLIYLQAAQLIAVFCGGAMAGGGQHNSLSLGAIVGAWNGVIAILFQQVPPELITSLTLYTSPLLHASVASLGAGIGAWVWQPVKDADLGPMAATTKKKAKPSKPLFAGRVAWVRVTLGTALAVAGYVYAAETFKKILDLSGGKLGTESSFQDRLIVWEIRGLAILAAGFFAGILTTNGLKQGLFVALGSAIVLIGIQTTKPGDFVEAVGIILASTFGVGMVGGWFGAALFPPVMSYKPRRSAAAAQA